MDRRRYLRWIGAAAIAGGAGCPTLAGGSGPELWEFRHSHPVGALAVDDQAVYAATVPPTGRTTQLASVAADAGNERWTRAIGVSGRILDVQARQNHLFIQNGRTLIVTPTGFTDASWRRQGATPPIVVDDTAYLRTVVAGATWTEAVDIADGSTAWRVKLSDRDQIPDTRYPVAAAADVIAVTDRRFPLMALATADGSIRWESDAPTGALVDATTSTFYVGMEGTRDATLEAYDVATGDRTIILRTGGETVEPAVVNGFLRVGITGGGVHAIVGMDPTTDTELWRRDGFRGPASWTTDTTVYALDDRDRLVALRRQDGTVRWRRDLPVDQDRPRLFPTDTAVVAATADTITSIEPEDGTVRWTRTVDRSTDTPDRYPIAVGSEIVVYAADRTVEALAP